MSAMKNTLQQWSPFYIYIYIYIYILQIILPHEIAKVDCMDYANCLQLVLVYNVHFRYKMHIEECECLVHFKYIPSK